MLLSRRRIHVLWLLVGRVVGILGLLISLLGLLLIDLRGLLICWLGLIVMLLRVHLDARCVRLLLRSGHAIPGGGTSHASSTGFAVMRNPDGSHHKRDDEQDANEPDMVSVHSNPAIETSVSNQRVTYNSSAPRPATAAKLWLKVAYVTRFVKTCSSRL